MTITRIISDAITIVEIILLLKLAYCVSNLVSLPFQVEVSTLSATADNYQFFFINRSHEMDHERTAEN
jgi:hypothetical protein